MKAIFLAGTGLLLLSGGIALAVQGDARPDQLAYRDAAVVAQGEAIYGTYCASCHGAGLGGQPDWQTRDADGYLPAPPHDESGHTWHHPDDQLFEIVKYGTEALVGGGYRSNMAGFSDVLSDAEIRAVLAYVKSTWPARIIERHDEMNAAFDAAR
jgi:mono/diheme cytochrome c family protein